MGGTSEELDKYVADLKLEVEKNHIIRTTYDNLTMSKLTRILIPIMYILILLQI